MKTNPVGIRFEKEDLELIKKRENLNTPQQVVYFLCSEYCKLYRVTKPSVFIDTSKKIYDGQEVNLSKIDEVGQYEEPKETLKDFLYFKNKILSSETISEIEKIVKEIDGEVLTFFEKRDLKLLAKEHSKTFYND